MRLPLVPHPDSRHVPAIEIEVEVARPDRGVVRLRYVATGAVGGVHWPAVRPAGRADGLWRHTCFEAFVRPWPDGVYYEFNFSPSTQWAAYRFADYRAGMAAAEAAAGPGITVEDGPGRRAVAATLDLRRLSEFAEAASGRLGLAAVIEDADRHLSYWALAHPAGKPDFHHPAGFAHDLQLMAQA